MRRRLDASRSPSTHFNNLEISREANRLKSSESSGIFCSSQLAAEFLSVTLLAGNSRAVRARSRASAIGISFGKRTTPLRAKCSRSSSERGGIFNVISLTSDPSSQHQPPVPPSGSHPCGVQLGSHSPLCGQASGSQITLSGAQLCGHAGVCGHSAGVGSPSLPG